MITAGDSFWRGKKVFVTGHTGFKGAWMCAVLRRLGAQVTGYALQPPTQKNLFDILKVERDIHHIIADVRDRDRLTAAVAAAQPDIVIHMAAQALVRLSYRAPADTFDVNVMGTVNALEAVRAAPGVRACVVVTTDKCYANDETAVLFSETDRLGGRDPYSASKAAAELVAHSYAQCYFHEGGTAIASARAGNVIGGGDWAEDRLIPDAVRAAGSGETLRIRSPKATRPWQHVLEPVCGYLHLAQQLYTQGRIYGGGWNFGPRREDIQSVEAVLTELKKYISFDIALENAPQPYEAKTLGLSIQKAQDELGWQPRTTLAQAVEWTGQWYAADMAQQDMAAFTQGQIDGYLTAPALRKAAGA